MGTPKLAVLLSVLVCGASPHAATLLDSFNPGVGQLVAVGFDTTSDTLYVYPAFGADILQLDTSGTVLNSVARPVQALTTSTSTSVVAL